MFHVNVIELHMSSRHIGSVSNEGIPYVLAGVPDLYYVYGVERFSWHGRVMEFKPLKKKVNDR